MVAIMTKTSRDWDPSPGTALVERLHEAAEHLGAMAELAEPRYGDPRTATGGHAFILCAGPLGSMQSGADPPTDTVSVDPRR